MTDTDKLGRELAPEVLGGIVDEALRGEHTVDEIAAANAIELSLLKRALAAHYAANPDDERRHRVGARGADDAGAQTAREDMPRKKGQKDKRARRTFTDEERHAIIEQIQEKAKTEGISMTAATEQMGYSVSMVHNWKVSLGLSETDPRDQAKYAQVIAAVKAGATVPTIMKRFKLPQTTAQRWAAAARAEAGSQLALPDTTTDTTTLLSRPTPPRSGPVSAPRSLPPSGYGTGIAPQPAVEAFAREALSEALEDRTTLRRMVALLQRENEQLKRELDQARAVNG